MRTSIRCLFLILYVTTGVSSLTAQNVSMTEGKDHRLITRVFDSSNNETIVSVRPDFFGSIAGVLLASSDAQPNPGSRQRLGFMLRTIYYTYPGEIAVRPRTVNFVFVSDEGKTQYKDNLDFSVDIDGAPLHQGKMAYNLKDSGSGSGPPIEALTVAVPPEIFLRIGQAKKVNLMLGAKKYKLSDSQRKDIRALAETIP